MVADRAEAVRSLFDRIAPVYDEFNDRLSFGLHRIWKRMAINGCGARRGDRTLDLCCGSGDLSLLLAQTVARSRAGDRAGSVTGLDFSANLLAAARRRAARSPWGDAITWIEGDVLDLPFADGTFDCATMGYGLRNVVDIPQALAQVRRVLRPGGSVAILDMHRPEGPWMRQFQRWYLDAIVVPAAADCGLTDDYAYIWPSLEQFPTGPQQVALARAAGFARAVHYPIAGGMMGLLVATVEGEKP
ncbi:MAG: bifunctional demethylmenaquinone methyltransferase/2-methoxy-6-polyprenyl-1,4-benzoquinol methylase UbiE [Cyanobacteria bacterium]|nr:bifunctional demethylmenaquinone methyltransferase/2-methoxy-6-polyprenyl-1,4-benzoquinol methylase UbiE [Cyanobacteriota bacterium]